MDWVYSITTVPGTHMGQTRQRAGQQAHHSWRGELQPNVARHEHWPQSNAHHHITYYIHITQRHWKQHYSKAWRRCPIQLT